MSISTPTPMPTLGEARLGPLPDVTLGRRALPRVAISFPVRLQLAGLPCPLDARARDLSVGGVGVETPTRFALRDLRRVTLLPPGGRIDLAAEGCWQTEAPGEGAFLAGIRFLELDGGALGRLWDLVHEQTKTLTCWLARQQTFEALSLSDIMDFVHLTRLREVPAGARVYRQGEAAKGEDSIFVVMRGEVVLETRTPRQRKLFVARAQPGQMLGGAALVVGVVPAETAIVEREATLLEISRGAFENLKQTNPGLAFQISAIAMHSHLMHQETALVRAVDDH